MCCLLSRSSWNLYAPIGVGQIIVVVIVLFFERNCFVITRLVFFVICYVISNWNNVKIVIVISIWNNVENEK